MNFRKILTNRIDMSEVREIVSLTRGNDKRKSELYGLLYDQEDKIAFQAAWIMTHFSSEDNEWLYDKQNELIDEVLTCTHTGKRRLLLTLLYRQPPADPPRVDFLDFCLEQMISQAEPPGIRSLCMKIAFELCRPIPELLQELHSTLRMMERESSPAILTSKKNILKSIAKNITCLIIALFCAGCSQKDEYQLVWSDEFDYDGTPDTTVWNFEKGFVRNREHQWYQEENAQCENGLLIIEARHEKRANPGYEEGSEHWGRSREYIEYTSSSINTARKREFLYGRVVVRARIPTAGGAWPAIWTLGTKMRWPSNGEIDIMEYYRIKGVPHILANAAWGTDQPYNAKWATKTIPFTHFRDKDPKWAEKFHIWRMDWDETSIKLYLDDELLNEISLEETINGSLGEYKNPFKQPHYLLLNLAIGGNNGGEPDVDAFPMKYEIDYVRVYQKKNRIRPGAFWPDNNGNHINAHGGGILFHKDKYYWFGEHKGERSNNALVGVTCYSSKDLYNWTYEGVALPVEETDESSPIIKGCVMERPKVIYNTMTKKFVMYFHLEHKGKGYSAAEVGVAVGDKVTGPYQLVANRRVNAGVWPQGMTEEQKTSGVALDDFEEWWTPEWREAVNEGLFVRRDFEGGQMSRDMTLYVDDDGKAYHIYSSEENLTIHIAELTDDYLNYSGRYIRIEPGGHNEAPAIFKKEGTYWMITSGCTGWRPNEARMFSSGSIWGPWTKHLNPCVGDDAELTFNSQSTFILPVQNKKDLFIFMADRWQPRNPINGRYVWLPIRFKNDKPILRWLDEWTLSDYY